MAIRYSIPVGFANTRFRFSCAGVDHQMGFSMGHAVTVAAEALDIVGITTSFIDHVLDGGSGMSSAYTFVGTTSIFGVVEEGDGLYENPENLAGTFGPSACPPNCAILVQKKTGLAGRKNRGRCFVPPFSVLEGDFDAAGRMTGAIATGVTGLYEAWRDEAETEGYAFHLLHQYDDEAIGTPPAPTPIINLAVSPLLATQRNRMR